MQYSGPGLRSKIENKLRRLPPDFRNTASSPTARPEVLRLHHSRKCPLSCSRRRVQPLHITCLLRVLASQSIGQPRSSLLFRKTASASNGVSVRVAAIGNGAAFRKGREFAVWLGIVPRRHSTGGKAKLFGISKRGDAYLRRILIHGARAAVLHIKLDRAPIGAWLAALDARAPKNVVVVAMANKLARIAWAVLSSGNEYRPVTARKWALSVWKALRAPTFPHYQRRLELSHRSLQRGSKDERTVTTACPQPAVTNGPQRPTSLEGQTRAQLILARRTPLPNG